MPASTTSPMPAPEPRRRVLPLPAGHGPTSPATPPTAADDHRVIHTDAFDRNRRDILLGLLLALPRAEQVEMATLLERRHAARGARHG